MILLEKNHNMRPLGALTVCNTHTTITHVSKAHVDENKGFENFNNRVKGCKNLRERKRMRKRSRKF